MAMVNKKFLTENARITDAYMQVRGTENGINESKCCKGGNGNLLKSLRGSLPIDGKGSARTGSKLGKRNLFAFEKRDAKNCCGHNIPLKKNRQFQRIGKGCCSKGGISCSPSSKNKLGVRKILPFEKRDVHPTTIGRISRVRDVGKVKKVHESYRGINEWAETAMIPEMLRSRGDSISKRTALSNVGDYLGMSKADLLDALIAKCKPGSGLCIALEEIKDKFNLNESLKEAGFEDVEDVEDVEDDEAEGCEDCSDKENALELALSAFDQIYDNLDDDDRETVDEVKAEIESILNPEDDEEDIEDDFEEEDEIAESTINEGVGTAVGKAAAKGGARAGRGAVKKAVSGAKKGAGEAAAAAGAGGKIVAALNKFEELSRTKALRNGKLNVKDQRSFDSLYKRLQEKGGYTENQLKEIEEQAKRAVEAEAAAKAATSGGRTPPSTGGGTPPPVTPTEVPRVTSTTGKGTPVVSAEAGAGATANPNVTVITRVEGSGGRVSRGGGGSGKGKGKTTKTPPTEIPTGTGTPGGVGPAVDVTNTQINQARRLVERGTSWKEALMAVGVGAAGAAAIASYFKDDDKKKSANAASKPETALAPGAENVATDAEQDGDDNYRKEEREATTAAKPRASSAIVDGTEDYAGNTALADDEDFIRKRIEARRTAAQRYLKHTDGYDYGDKEEKKSSGFDFGGLTELPGKLIGGIGSGIGSLGKGIGDAASGIGTGFGAAAANLGAGIGGGANSLGRGIGNAIGGITSAFTPKPSSRENDEIDSE